MESYLIELSWGMTDRLTLEYSQYESEILEEVRKSLGNSNLSIKEMANIQLEEVKNTIKLANYIYNKFEALSQEYSHESFKLSLDEAHDMAISARAKKLDESDIDSLLHLTRSVHKR